MQELGFKFIKSLIGIETKIQQLKPKISQGFKFIKSLIGIETNHCCVYGSTVQDSNSSNP